LYQFGDGLNATATDVCDPAPKIEVVGVTSNQPPTGGGSGNTTADVLFGKRAFCVNAERAGTVSTPRVYTVTVRATDASGNSATKDVTISVPHDQAGPGCTAVDPSRVVDDSDPRCIK
jgi:hypothetical protein